MNLIIEYPDAWMNPNSPLRYGMSVFKFSDPGTRINVAPYVSSSVSGEISIATNFIQLPFDDVAGIVITCSQPALLPRRGYVNGVPFNPRACAEHGYQVLLPNASVWRSEDPGFGDSSIPNSPRDGIFGKYEAAIQAGHTVYNYPTRYFSVVRPIDPVRTNSPRAFLDGQEPFFYLFESATLGFEYGFNHPTMGAVALRSTYIVNGIKLPFPSGTTGTLTITDNILPASMGTDWVQSLLSATAPARMPISFCRNVPTSAGMSLSLPIFPPNTEVLGGAFSYKDVFSKFGVVSITFGLYPPDPTTGAISGRIQGPVNNFSITIDRATGVFSNPTLTLDTNSYTLTGNFNLPEGQNLLWCVEGVLVKP